MSTLWTPGGEHEPDDRESTSEGVAADGPDDDAAREQLHQLREQLAATPVSDIVANHAIGLWELALLHLSPEDGMQPNLEEAQLAIDAVAALVEGLEGRLSRHEEALREALSQLRLAYVEISRRVVDGVQAGDETEGENG